MNRLLILILVIGFLLRFSSLASTPLVNRDELAIGYNAYSIMLTGKDEYGIQLPLSFRSFGDYKLPGLVYATVLPISLFGRSVFSIRFINALAGTLSIVLFYWIIKLAGKNQLLALIAAFFLAISPWHIHGSRSAYEPIVGLLWTLLGYGFLLKSRLKFRYMFAFLLSMIVGSFFYNSIFILLPFIFGLYIFLLYFSNEKISRKQWIVVGVIAVFLIGYWAFLSDINESRVNTTIFSQQSLDEKPFILSRSVAKDLTPAVIARIVQLPFLYQLTQFFRGYVSSFSPAYIWFDGGNNPWHNLDFIKFGNIFFVTLPLFIYGLLDSFKQLSKRRFSTIFFIGLLFISPLANALTTDAPNTNRLMDFHLAITYFTALGFYLLLIKRKFRWVAIETGLLIISFGIFTMMYFSSMKDDPHPLWNKSLDSLVTQLHPIDQQYPLIHITSPGEFSYIYAAFFTPFNPDDFQKEAIRTNKGFEQVISFRQYRFESFTPVACYKILEVTPAQLGETADGKILFLQNRFGEPVWKAVEKQL